MTPTHTGHHTCIQSSHARNNGAATVMERAHKPAACGRPEPHLCPSNPEPRTKQAMLHHKFLYP